MSEDLTMHRLVVGIARRSCLLIDLGTIRERELDGRYTARAEDMFALHLAATPYEERDFEYLRRLLNDGNVTLEQRQFLWALATGS